jgi:hypothetical protein
MEDICGIRLCSSSPYNGAKMLFADWCIRVQDPFGNQERVAGAVENIPQADGVIDHLSSRSACPGSDDALSCADILAADIAGPGVSRFRSR